MLKRILTVLGLCLFIFFLATRGRIFKNTRGVLEQQLVIPARSYLSELLLGISEKEGKNIQKSLKELALEERIKELEAQNRALRKQLGSIPEKGNLYPAKVVWQTSSELMLDFSYAKNTNLIGKPVVLENIFLGRVVRQGKRLLVVEKPTSSKFSGLAETERQVAGRVKGEFNEKVIFEAPVEADLYKNEKVYYLDRENGWKFLLGEIESIDDNERLPTKQATVRYYPGKSVLKLVFVVL